MAKTFCMPDRLAERLKALEAEAQSLTCTCQAHDARLSRVESDIKTNARMIGMQTDSSIAQKKALKTAQKQWTCKHPSESLTTNYNIPTGICRTWCEACGWEVSRDVTKTEKKALKKMGFGQ